MQKFFQKGSDQHLQVEFEDWLIPTSMCAELLPEQDPRMREANITNEEGTHHDTKAEIARSIMQGASKATLGSMILWVLYTQPCLCTRYVTLACWHALFSRPWLQDQVFLLELKSRVFTFFFDSRVKK
jgi:hypothetical protein